MMDFEYFAFINGEGLNLQNFYENQCAKKAIFKKGDNVKLFPDMYALVNKGLIKIYMINSSGNEKLMWFLKELTLIPNHLLYIFDKRIVAEENSEILYVKKDEFLNFILSSPKNLDTILQQFYKRYALCIQEILNENTYNSKTKVYKFIFQLIEVLGKKNTQGQIIIENMPTRKDIASIVGTHRSNVTRYITELEKLDILEKAKGAIIVKDIDALKKIIEDNIKEI
ncbi:MAG TPA: Crp/Fnr family transcriptional regulator [Desulfitobacterium dehalogenans]|uniref:Crp/Fnr family transcriptional regulator n=1 Tax=Desulfitobacterium dehalogenans TaxID=36854 RepID=A0A7C7DB22_9FIRM|nr:Crp/Fnr family transcriptional regulator [Desulfitobacterium dehalogenans]